MYRHGYYARRDGQLRDTREYVANARIGSAGAYGPLIRDIPIELSVAFEDLPTKSGSGLSVKVQIPPSSIAFTEVDGRRRASLDVAVFVGDSRKKSVGELRQKVELNLTPESYERIGHEGVMFSGRVDVTARPRYVKVVVYDAGADRLGSAVAEVR